MNWQGAFVAVICIPMLVLVIIGIIPFMRLANPPAWMREDIEDNEIEPDWGDDGL